MHFTSHKALIKSPGEHAVAIEMSQQRAETQTRGDARQDVELLETQIKHIKY